MSLPGRLRADQDGDVTAWVERDIGGLVAHRAADLDIGRHTDAAHQTEFLRSLGSLGKLFPVSHLHRPFHMRGEVAGIVHLAGRRRVRHRFGGNEILAADRIRRHAQFARAGIDQTLDDIGRLGTPGTAIGIDRHRMGENGANPAVEFLDVIEPRQHAGAAMRDVGAEGREIGAHVGHQIDIHRQEFAVFGQRHPGMSDVVAALGVADEMIGAVRGPFDVLAQLLCRHRDKRIFAVRKQPRAETAADIRTDHPHLVMRDLEDVIAQDVAQPMAALAADGKCQVVAFGVIFADRGAGLQIIDDDARIDDPDVGYERRLGEHRIDGLLVADRHVEQHIAGMFCPNLRRFLLHGLRQPVDRRQRRPCDLDRLDGIARLVDGLGDDKGHGVADMAHFPGGEDRIVRAGEWGVRQVEQARQSAQILDVVGGEDRGDAGQRAGARGVERKGCVRVRRAQHQRMQGLRRVVVGIAAMAADQRIVFLA